MAGLLSVGEAEALQTRLDEVSQRQKLDVTILTVDGLEGYSDALDYADDAYEFLPGQRRYFAADFHGGP